MSTLCDSSVGYGGVECAGVEESDDLWSPSCLGESDECADDDIDDVGGRREVDCGSHVLYG